MVLLLIVVSMLLLVRLYPLAVFDWLDRAANREEERYQAAVAQYVSDVHDTIDGMKAELKTADLDERTRQHLTQMCDDYERALRNNVVIDA
jgi:ABC-type transport system involved in cytochrome bd biosynthesis fused ATPase/permease subunit